MGDAVDRLRIAPKAYARAARKATGIVARQDEGCVSSARGNED